MGHDDTGEILATGGLYESHHAFPVDGIEGTSRFVGEQQLSLTDDCTGDRHR